MSKSSGEPVNSAALYLPDSKSLKNLKEAANHCQGCDLYKHATQTVFGDGNPHAPVILVGEQPGDQEDKQGHPFVGPAGKLLDRAMKEANLRREDVYLTNTVKHFSFVWRGKHRIHQKPRMIEVNSCLPWLHAEIEQVSPQVVVCLGATAAQALLGKTFRITKERGVFIQMPHSPFEALATYHPSAILRAPDEEQRAEHMESLVRDLALVAERLRIK